ncbi:MAG: HAMP domain-containing histidine kinase [Streptosporangiaceae bacterium]|nr:HAMP domain-containing histidine kinase [Streptosporangiaceae bacterium]
MRSRWHRSLQLRVVATTLLLSALVIAVLGFFLTQAVANGLQSNAEKTARGELSAGVVSAEGQSQPDVQAPPLSPGDEVTSMQNAMRVMLTTASTLQQATGNSGNYFVFVCMADAGARLGFPAFEPCAGPKTVDQHATIPAALRDKVAAEQTATGPARTVIVKPTVLTYTSQLGSSQPGPEPALAAGAPLGRYYQLYYVFPFDQQQQTLYLVQKILIGVGLALVALLAAIASLVTRWVVLPVRHAAQAAQRLSAGHLDERMRVQGSDDLAALATSFNEMAISLQEKLRQLEELSSVQRQFVSDVSHELRTPLSTIKMAADLLFESRDELDPVAARSVELLQSQIERFEELLVDLLEISRYDAGAATLDAEPVDVCDLVRRSADDAQQLAERRSSRIEFRLPAEGCVAEVDRRRVERILRNILVNAVEHGESRDVVVTAAMDSDAVAVAVRDYGVGLRPGEEQLVFDRFWRADPARARTTGGSGLGLAISLEDAHLHGGWLQAWGERGKGSVFRLTLPRTAGRELVGSPLPLGPDEAAIVATPGRPDSYPGPEPYPGTEISSVSSRG